MKKSREISYKIRYLIAIPFFLIAMPFFLIASAISFLGTVIAEFDFKAWKMPKYSLAMEELL